MTSVAHSDESPVTHRILTALTTSETWRNLSLITAEAWIRLGGASASVLISPQGADRMELVCCRSLDGDFLQFSELSIETSFSRLLNQAAAVDLAAEAGLIGGLNLQVHFWPDLAATLINQFPDAPTAVPEHSFHETLSRVCRLALSRASNRPVLVPCHTTLEAMAEFAAGAGHEINNPLASIIGQSQLLLKSEQSAERRQASETIGAQAWRIRDMIGDSMLFARPPQPQMQKFNLVEVARDTLVSLTSAASDRGVDIRLASTSDVIDMEADQTQIRTLISHLVQNSLEAISRRNRQGNIVVTLRDDVSGSVEISVTDDGPGIESPEVRRNLFNPFYSGRSAGRGLGFGLCLAWQITRMHGGILIYEDNSGGGAVFHAALKAVQELR